VIDAQGTSIGPMHVGLSQLSCCARRGLTRTTAAATRRPWRCECECRAALQSAATAQTASDQELTRNSLATAYGRPAQFASRSPSAFPLFATERESSCYVAL
jgi:hypothetical protein